MHTRTVVAVVGALLGFSALCLPVPAAQAAAAAHHPVPVAHRGASAYAPENTLAAVDKARQLGITWVENDVQRTRDGALIVMHDTTLARTTNAEQVFPGRAPWRISDFTLKEIKRLDAGGWFAPQYAGQRVPTLNEYLTTVERNHQSLLLEIKSPELYPAIEAQTLFALWRKGWLNHEHITQRLVIQSFSANCVRLVHKLSPAVKTGFLGTPPVAALPAYAKFTDQINPSYRTVTAQYIQAVHRVAGAHGKPLEVYTWTVNERPTAAWLAGLGVDGIISNAPDVIRDATARRTSDALAGAAS